MCRSTIARVISIDDGYAVVDVEGVRRRASTLLVPDLAPDELVLIGLGAVLGRVDPADLEALRALDAGIPSNQPRPTAG